MAVHTWNETHELDPYKPLKSEVEPLEIQVVAMDWKWLFIYPKQGIASLNYFQFPERTPIHLKLAADGSPMNSFWLPQLSGQIYAMSGMVTQLHLMADAPGIYKGRAAEINGEGYADMTFIAKSTTESDFEEWVANVKQSPLQLNNHLYNKLIAPSLNNPTTLYSTVEEGLFNKIVMKYMHSPSESSCKTP
jgi:cytochrome o ubiquinol oxidase subunit 2